MRIVMAIFVLATALLAQMAQPHSSVNSQDVERVAENTGIANAKAISNFADCSSRGVRWEHMQGTLALSNGKILHEWWEKIDQCQPRGTALLCPNNETAMQVAWILNPKLRARGPVLTDTSEDGIKPHCGPKRSFWKTYEF